MKYTFLPENFGEKGIHFQTTLGFVGIFYFKRNREIVAKKKVLIESPGASEKRALTTKNFRVSLGLSAAFEQRW